MIVEGSLSLSLSLSLQNKIWIDVEAAETVELIEALLYRYIYIWTNGGINVFPDATYVHVLAGWRYCRRKER
jgi:hypothetical protein